MSENPCATPLSGTSGTPTVYAVLRIPKSGSTSLADAVINALQPRSVHYLNTLIPDARVSTVERLRALRKLYRRRWKTYGVLSEAAQWRKIRAGLADGDVVSGHFTYGSVRLEQAAVRYVTILRDPIQQFLSEFKWLRHGYDKRTALQRLYHRGRPSAATSVDAFLDFLEAHAGLFRNPVTRFVTGDPDHPAPFAHLVELFFCFGLLEDTPGFCRAFARQTGRPLVFPHLNLSPSPTAETLHGEPLARFQRLCGADLELYARVREHLRE